MKKQKPIKYVYLFWDPDGKCHISEPTTDTIKLRRYAAKLADQHGDPDKAEIYRTQINDAIGGVRGRIKYDHLMTKDKKTKNNTSLASIPLNAKGERTKRGSSWAYKKQWLANKKAKLAAQQTETDA